MKMRSFYLASVGAAAFMAGAVAAQAEDPAKIGLSAGDILIRARMLGAIPQVHTDYITVIGGKAAVDNSYEPEVDFSYYLTDNLAFEVIASSTRHGVRVNGSALGNVDLGSVWLLPPIVSAQWHFLPKQAFNPYLGVGANYTLFYNVTKSSAVNKVKYESGFGYAFEAGADYDISGPWFFNVDVKKLFRDTTVKVNGGVVRAKVDIDPWIVGVGVGYRF